jgi:UDP-N-acetylglucosamine--N-acetylmuramyl-(pentapeptide) pyrophosphoryl-undecaprenol N-acetylglucosamine transferase
VHEANPRPGIANRLGAMMTTHVFTGHPDARLRHARYIGVPIRRQIAELDRLALGDTARGHFGLRTDMPVLLVTGGSQGARSLNRALAGAVDAILAAGIQVLHVTGPKHASEISPPPGRVPYAAVPYVDRMDLAYAAADFALCRAGAMTCAELTAVGLPAAYVPLPIGNGEQRLNAMPIVQQGGGMIVDDAELTPEWIKSSLLPVLTNVDRVVAMSEAAARLGRRDADRALARAVIEVLASTPARPAAIAAASAPAAQPEPPAAGQQWPPQAPDQQALHQQAPSPLARRQPGARQQASDYQSAPVPEGGFFQPTQERAASQRAASARPAPGPSSSPGTAPSPGRHRHAR